MNRIAILILLISASLGTAHAQGQFQKTMNNGVLVWNNRPKPGDMATWAGGRDAQGYAHSAGTLTWWKESRWISKYSGTMVHGRLEGFVRNEDADGAAFSGTFRNGQKQSDWKAVTSVAVVDKRPTPQQPEVKAKEEAGMAEPLLTDEEKKHLLGAIASDISSAQLGFLGALMSGGGGRQNALRAIEQLCPSSTPDERNAALNALHRMVDDDMVAVYREHGRAVYKTTLHKAAGQQCSSVTTNQKLIQVMDDVLDLAVPFK